VEQSKVAHRMKRKQPVTKPAAAGFDAESFLHSTGPARKVVTYQPRDVVFAQGDAADDVRYLQQGTIKLSVLSHGGKEAVVAILTAGDFFGEGALAGQTVRIATATAVEPSIALEMVRQGREKLREAGETARVAGEQARTAAEAARHATVEAVEATAAALQSTLEQMKAMEEMRRTLRDIQDVKNLERN
jgi:CRP-like cAMP-binding protein